MHDLFQVIEKTTSRDEAKRAIDLGASRVLVVDDSSVARELIGAFLQLAGIERVQFAANGVEGLEKAASFDPDLVILDIMMPEMDGFEMCHRLRADPRFARLAILAQTALESLEQRTAIFRAGANDLVSKPLHGPELIARVRVHLENRHFIRDLEAYRTTMAADLGVARDMQLGLLPSRKAMLQIGAETGLEIDSHFQPSSELGGDMWALHGMGDGRICVGTVDFAGHGVSAALNTFRLHTLMQQIPPPQDSPAAYLEELNAMLVDLLPIQQFATMFVAIVDCPAGTLTYAGAGAPCPLLGCGGNIHALDASGLPLGITKNPGYADCRAEFGADAFLLLYSDAVLETPDQDGRMMEPDELTALVRGASPLRKGFLPRLLEGFRAGRDNLDDDLTLVWLARRDAAS